MHSWSIFYDKISDTVSTFRCFCEFFFIRVVSINKRKTRENNKKTPNKNKKNYKNNDRKLWKTIQTTVCVIFVQSVKTTNHVIWYWSYQLSFNCGIKHKVCHIFVWNKFSCCSFHNFISFIVKFLNWRLNSSS